VRPRSSESGFSLVALAATVTIMLILMTVGVSSWQYVMRNEKEEEAIFRGVEITDAIRRFQRKGGNALPPTLDILVEKKFLRKHALKDPLTKDGKWKILHQGDLIAPILPGQLGPGKEGNRGLPSPSPSPSSSSSFGAQGQKVGPIVGVATGAKGKSLRIFNGQQDYKAWMFTINQPKPIIGALPLPLSPKPNKSPGAPSDPGSLPGTSEKP
jgi:type II secretory pathway pseudopilin PulG